MAAGDTLIVFTPQNNVPPAANPATLDQRNNHLVLDFDATTAEAAIFTGIMPAHWTTGGLVYVVIHYMASTAITGTASWDAAFERCSILGTDLDADSFDTAKTGADLVPGTTGQVGGIAIGFDGGAAAEMDGIAPGDLFRLRIRRDVAGDSVAGDLELLAVELQEA